ncbi:alpha/beta hydrolase [Yinghuangia soli]|uniref:Alpha/beta hydrolase n=1 Tax=Yinghuangia soli TaxID=2908204 RepID=A0AA41U4B9_9ACTN|nr:alpha/beta hydrolase [Yinghuangia soli]MCF2532740.1 alpha/beta hydrolase [Yinghuangia soli]
MPELTVPMARSLVRNTVRRFLHPRVPVAVQRALLELNPGVLPPGTHVLRRAPGGVPARRVSVGPTVPERTMLYLHGGAYVVGSSRSYLAWAAHLARATRSTVYVLDYRLAPEHPYPAALEDARAAWRAIAEDAQRAPDTPLVVAGDSAGGGLALTLALDLAAVPEALRSPAERRPDAAVLISPWLDPLRPWAYEPIYHQDPVLHTAWLSRCADMYAAGTDRETLAPARNADLSVLPPTIVQNGTDDLLAPEGAAFVERARAAGASVDHTEYPDLWHVFQVMAGVLPAADEALHDLAKSLDAILKS